MRSTLTVMPWNRASVRATVAPLASSKFHAPTSPVVGGGVVLAASYEAKAFGIQGAMGGRQARRLCPHAIVVPPRMDAYSAASTALFEVFNDTTPFVEGLSIDEMAAIFEKQEFGAASDFVRPVVDGAAPADADSRDRA